MKSESFTHGSDTISNSVLITDGVSNGNHWTLDTERKLAYYSDSLSWVVPSNLTQMVEPLLNKIGIQLDCYTLSPINSTSGASTSHLFKPAPIYVWCYSIVHGSSNVWCMEQLARMESK